MVEKLLDQFAEADQLHFDARAWDVVPNATPFGREASDPISITAEIRQHLCLKTQVGGHSKRRNIAPSNGLPHVRLSFGTHHDGNRQALSHGAAPPHPRRFRCLRVGAAHIGSTFRRFVNVPPYVTHATSRDASNSRTRLHRARA